MDSMDNILSPGTPIPTSDIPIKEETTPVKDNSPITEIPLPTDDQSTPQDDKPKRKRREKIPNAEVIPRKKRGAKQEEETKVIEIQPAEFFGQQLYGLHQIAALMTGLPVTISEEDAKKLGEAVHGVVKQYDLSWINKFTPVINLLVVTAVVEAPVIIRGQAALAEKRALARQNKLQPVNHVIENGVPVKDSLTQVPEAPSSGGIFANVSSDMKGVEIRE